MNNELLNSLKFVRDLTSPSRRNEKTPNQGPITGKWSPGQDPLPPRPHLSSTYSLFYYSFTTHVIISIVGLWLGRSMSARGPVTERN